MTLTPPLAGGEAQGGAEGGVAELLPGHPRAGEAPVRSLPGVGQELAEDRRCEPAQGVSRLAGGESHDLPVRHHHLRVPRPLQAAREIQGEEADPRNAVSPHPHLANRGGGRLDLPRPRPTMHGHLAGQGDALGEGQGRQALPERGVVHFQKGERALVIDPGQAGGGPRLQAQLLHLDQDVVAHGGAGDQDAGTLDHQPAQGAGPRALLGPGRLPVPLLARDPDRHHRRPQSLGGARPRGGRGRRPRPGARRTGGQERGGQERPPPRGSYPVKSHTGAGSRSGRHRLSRGRGPRSRPPPRTPGGGSARGFPPGPRPHPPAPSGSCR